MHVHNKKARILWVVGTVIALLISYLLCRYAFFELHGNKQWPFVLLVISFVATGIAAILKSYIMMVCTVSGYLGGFFIGQIQGVDSFDQSGSLINDWWLKWTIVFIVIIAIAAIWELFCKVIEERRN